MNGHRYLDERYFDWLCRLVGMVSNRNPAQSHVLLAEKLFTRQFEDWLPNDDNRAEDGKLLREEFLIDQQLEESRLFEWLDQDCSVLEMLVALSRRVADHTNWSPSDSFWLLLTNLELEKYTDERFNSGVSRAVDFVIDTLNDRTYERDGRGGLFPLEDPPTDQRKVEIWYQMSAYLMENYTY